GPGGVRGDARGHPPGPGSGEHRGAARLEADAPAAGVRRVRTGRGGGGRGSLRSGVVSALRIEPDRGRPGPGGRRDRRRTRGPTMCAAVAWYVLCRGDEVWNLSAA